MKPPRLLKPIEAAALLGVSLAKLDRLRYAGVIPHIKIGGILYDEIDVLEAKELLNAPPPAHIQTPRRDDPRKWAQIAVLLRRPVKNSRI